MGKTSFKPGAWCKLNDRGAATFALIYGAGNFQIMDKSIADDRPHVLWDDIVLIRVTEPPPNDRLGRQDWEDSCFEVGDNWYTTFNEHWLELVDVEYKADQVADEEEDLL